MTSASVARVTVRSPALHERAEPLSFGVPFARGRVTDVDRLVAIAGGPLPTGARVAERWPDGSVRWAWLDVEAVVPAGGLVLDVRADVARPAAPMLDVVAGPRSIAISTARLRIVLDLDHAGLVARLDADGRCAARFGADAVHLIDAGGRSLPVVFSALAVEHHTALRVVTRASGRAKLGDGAIVNVDVRVTVLAGSTAIGIDLGLHNPRAAVHDGGFWELGDPGSLQLRGAGVSCAAPGAAVRAHLSLADGEPVHPVAVPLAVTQQGSGGEHWQSRVHVDRDGVVAVDGPGFVLDANGQRTSGSRAHPWLAIEHEAGRLGVTARRFWQLFPKAIDADAAGRLRVWSLPPGDRLHELQGGERCHFEWWLDADAAHGADGASWQRRPSTVLPAIEAVAAAEALPALEPAPAGPAGALAVYEGLIAAALDGADGFAAKRERIDEYGWRHFGDLYADHENGDDPALQRVSHYNNQYDAVLGLTLQALRHDDHRWWEMASDLAWHVARVDVYWTSADRAAYNGGTFWHTGHYVDAGKSTHRCYPRGAGLHGGGPSNEHCYSHGLLLHHLLTGDPLSRAAVVSLGDWVVAMDDGRLARWPLPWLARSATGGASATVSPEYHGPGRGPANAMAALFNAHRLSADPALPAKADELLRRVIHPDDDIAALELLDVERRWSYTVFLQALGRYLWTHAPDDGRYAYARASLLHYARWMADHEYCYLDKPEVLEFPTETWAAQDLRKSEVFDLAAYHAPSEAERSRFLERARYFHHRSLATLASSPTRTRTRPLVLLLQYGFARPWFERVTAGAPVHPLPAAAWPPPVRFRPQKLTVVRRLKTAAAVGAALLAGLVVAFLLR
ncbi:MAG: hypothetical protein R2745_10390 [Vicinamibacterales bacterium]